MSCFECIMYIFSCDRNVQSYDPLDTASTSSNMSDKSKDDNDDWDNCSE